jgi:SAM-dependent methyltransferase
MYGLEGNGGSDKALRPWADKLRRGDDWEWQGRQLVNRNRASVSRQSSKRLAVYSAFVTLIYADQNRSRRVRSVIQRLVNELSESALALNFGCGATRYPRVVNYDIVEGPNVDIVGIDSSLPFLEGTIDLIIMQEVLEHVADIWAALDEVRRVLKVGGKLYLQVPFQIGFHPGPKDYWRFSRQALEFLFQDDSWVLEEIEISRGHGTALYRIAVEFFSVTFSVINRFLYKPVKLFSAICLYPLKLFDLITIYSLERDRIPGGYYCVVRKVR